MAQGFGRSSSPSPPSLFPPATEAQHIYQHLTSHFQNLSDPRGRQGILHPFLSIVIIALLATIAGAQGWEDIEIYAVSHQHSPRCWLGRSDRPMRYVFDTNVLIGALLIAHSLPAQALRKAENTGIILYSRPVLEELVEVLSRPR